MGKNASGKGKKADRKVRALPSERAPLVHGLVAGRCCGCCLSQGRRTTQAQAACAGEECE
jgi:hypothetical protein